MHIIINGSKNIFLGDMFRDQFVHILFDGLGQLSRIFAELLKNLLQHRIVHPLRHAKFPGIAVHKAGNVHHHVGQHLHIAFLGLHIYKGNRRVLDRIGNLRGHFGSGGRYHLAGGRIHGVCCQDLMPDPIAQRQLLVEFISADFGQIIPAGVKKHGRNQALSALHAQRLAGADLFV